MRRLLFLILTTFFARQVTTFEARYFSKDPRADGVTDLHGPTEIFDNDRRVDFLDSYYRFASRFWGDPEGNTPLFDDADIARRVAAVKPRPSTSVRTTLRLDRWKANGYRKGKELEQAARWKAWTAGGARISEGSLVLDGAVASPEIDPLDWRFRMRVFLDGVPDGLHVVFNREGKDPIDIAVGNLVEFELYGDLPNRRIFLSSGGRTVREISLGAPGSAADAVTSFSIGAPDGKASVDRLAFYAFDLQEDDDWAPYWSRLVYDETFEEVPCMEGWQEAGYDDSGWESVSLPSPHGGEKAAGESWYLRTRVDVGEFDQAFLELETLDPAGEVWINGEPAAVLKGRVPRKIDVAEWLRPGENVIAVRVKPYFGERTMLHAPSDHHFGWSLGRASLVLTKTPRHISEVLTHTLSLDAEKAIQHHRITVRNESHMSWKGSLEVHYYPWFPEDGPSAASLTREVELRPMTDNAVDLDLAVPEPELWNTGDPHLYKVEVVLKDGDGVPVDDYVTTTGVRLIEQIGGELFINHRPELLGGGQIFGFRRPVEYAAVTIRCATDEMVMRDLVMAKSLGNLLRIHVHAERDVPEGLNDPRYAEYADQLGLFLIWQTAGWIREGEVWNVDIAHYPDYMRQVFNHPSIVMWEASNHPTQFKNHGFSDTDDYFTDIISTIASTDSSRLISPTSFWQFTHYGNYGGTVDYEGNPLPENPWLMHRMMTRGSQDAYSGYDSDWSHLRSIPSPWAKSCLEARDLCYFNFEHEESIGQPNWSLARKEPWYEVFSYEKGYELKNVGRLLTADEWRVSQAYQAFSAWESMKIQTLLGVCGFSWCSLESGPNMFTYQKPLVDPFYVPKLAFHANRMVFNRTWAGSGDVDTAYGPGDAVRPVIFNLDGACVATLTVELQNEKGRVLERKVFRDVRVPEGRSVTRLEPFRFRNRSEGCYFIVYKLEKR